MGHVFIPKIYGGNGRQKEKCGTIEQNRGFFYFNCACNAGGELYPGFVVTYKLFFSGGKTFVMFIDGLLISVAQNCKNRRVG